MVEEKLVVRRPRPCEDFLTLRSPSFLWIPGSCEAWWFVKNRVSSEWGGVVERQFAERAALCRQEMFVAWKGIGIVTKRREASHLA